ncbi:hypothetical protein SAMN05421842_13028 [Clostridium uliginosum]|uniref:Uncharacterized protein n=1 Tax=Clostridium uliginosum TaxID=119641 RepID=A0A1I1RH69_9CLOT|nr:hypothetical protein SAMN05421842_13028 [Clostridium uliginosum]
MLNSISTLSQCGYENINESLELIFDPIVKKIISDLE